MRFNSIFIVMFGLISLSLAQQPEGDALSLVAREQDDVSIVAREQDDVTIVAREPEAPEMVERATSKSAASCKRAFEEFTSLNARHPHGIFERASRCGQFCSKSADCTDPRCPLCAHSNGACEWQKSCRART